MLKEKVYAILEVAHSDDKISRYFDIFILSLIALNGLALVLETVSFLSSRYADVFWWIEAVSVPIFTVEYILRLWACTANPRHSHFFYGRLEYALKPLSLVDLFAILPFYLVFLDIDLRIIRVLRIFRILRLAKLTRYSKAIWTFYRVFNSKRDELAIALTTIVILLVLASSLVYFAEHDLQPEVFSSIPAAMYWGVVTLSTVGYGDVVPLTHLGRFLGAITGLLGIAIFALPAGILASGFAEEVKKSEKPLLKCPHCGKSLDRRHSTDDNRGI